MPRLFADQVRFLVGLLFIIETIHCLQLVRFVGEASITAPSSTKRAGAAEAALSWESNDENRARALKMMSVKSAKSIGR